MPMLETNGLRKTFSSRTASVQAVRGVDLAVDAGEIFGFLGPNGAGKSTTVRMLTTLLSITSGTAHVAGVDVARQPDEARRRIGVALQEAGLDPRQTGRELLILQARLFGLSVREATERTGQLLELVELEDAADRRIKGYSGGMKRRLDLASALVHEPEVLFLDEPTTGLDPASRLTVWEEVRRINGRGTTVFLTTQYLEEADQLADRVGIIDRGGMVAEGTPEVLKSEVGWPSLEVTFTGDWNLGCEVLGRFGKTYKAANGALAVPLEDGAGGVAEIVRALDDAGLQVASLEVRRPTLDDVFLAKTGHALEPEEGEEPEPEAAPAASA